MNEPIYIINLAILVVFLPAILYDGIANAVGRPPGKTFEMLLRLAFVTTTVLHALLFGGAIWAGKFLVAVIVFPYLAEAYGVRFGFLGAKYVYYGKLGSILPGGVPIIIVAAWVILLYGSTILRAVLANLFPFFENPVAGIVAASLMMVMIDLILDPVMIVEKRWGWVPPGGWFGAPLLNFVMWFVTSVVALTVAEYLAGFPILVEGDPALWLKTLPLSALGLAMVHLSMILPGHGLGKLVPLSAFLATLTIGLYALCNA